MRRMPATLFPFLALIAALLFYASVEPWRFPRAGEGSAAASSFHGGWRTQPAAGGGACTAPTCHAPSPHRKAGPASAFLNMHDTVVSCLACHGRNPESGWGPGHASAGSAFLLVYSPVPGEGKGGRRHDANGPPTPCRRCHSTEGRRTIAAAGVKNLPEGFNDPIALRMIEGGGRKWMPDDMR